MGFAVGQSLEMIPVWREGRGLDYIGVEPWKIHRDPDAVTRNSQSGMYWIHQEYIDLYVLKGLEKTGKYSRVDKIGESSATPKDENLTKEEIAKRKNKIYQRSKFRKAPLVSEFLGNDSRQQREYVTSQLDLHFFKQRCNRTPQNYTIQHITMAGNFL